MYKFHEFVLSSGRIVHLDALHMDRTYGDLLSGRPDEEYNEKILARKRQHMVSVWGNRPTHLVRPDSRLVVEGPYEYMRMPELTYHAWLTSDPIEPRWCGSELVMVWFGPYDRETSIPILVERAIRDLPWEQLAGGYDE